MQDQRRFMMVSPASGFTNRVMTRLTERERARMQRRALLGSTLLVGAVIAMIAFALVQIVSDVWVLLTKPQVILAVLSAFQVLTFWVGAMLSACWIAANVIAANLDPIQTMSCAIAVLALTMLWARAVTGSFQLSSNYVGGFRK